MWGRASLKLKAMSLREAVSRAIDDARRQIGDPLARVAFLVPSRANGEQVRRVLGDHKAFIHVDFLTPDQVVGDLGTLALMRRGLLPEPSGWLGAWLHANVPLMAEEGVLGRHGETLSMPGWRGPIQSALRELQAGRVDAAMLQAVAGQDSLGERFELLAAIMERSVEARRAQRLFSQTELEDEALLQAQSNTSLPCQKVEAVVVLGDSVLSPGSFKVLQAWFKGKKVTRVALPPLEHLEPAPWGLRLSAGTAPVIEVSPVFSDLGHLKGRLFTPALVPCASKDGTVRPVSTPDEVREMSAVARVVQSAIHAGMALDKIAIVLPNSDGAEILESELAKASIPATWLTASSLARVPCARSLNLAVAIAQGEHTVQAWYALLTQTGIMGLPRSGRGRWRSLLRDCPRRRGFDAIMDHLVASHRKAVEAKDERTTNAAQSLLDAMGHLHESMQSFPQEGTLGEHARAWRSFMERWWRPGPELERVLKALDGWGNGDIDVRISLDAAARLFGEELASTQFLRGSLTHPAVRIVPPMGLLGGSFDLVCVTGMTEERFPRKPGENPLLTDTMIECLVQQGGQLVGSDQMIEVEKRRLGAIVAAADGYLWLSCPQIDMLEGTPRLPGSLLMGVLATLMGRRVRYAELGRLMQKEGSRSRPLAESPESALGAGEHLVVRAMESPQETLRVLASLPSARRLLMLHRSIDRLRTVPDAVPDEWTGLVPNELLEEDFGGAVSLSIRKMARMVKNPSEFLLRDLLKVRKPSSLGKAKYDVSQSGIRYQALDLLKEAVKGSEGTLESRFQALWDARVDAMAQHLAVDSEAQKSLWRYEGREAYQCCMGSLGQAALLEGVDGSTPRALPDVEASVTGHKDLLDAEQLVVLRSKDASKKPKLSDTHVFGAVAQALSLKEEGRSVKNVAFVGMDGTQRSESVDHFEGEFVETLKHTLERAQAGWWPSTDEGDPFALERERKAASKMTQEVTRDILGRFKP